MSKLTLTERIPIQTVINNWLKGIVRGVLNVFKFIGLSFVNLIKAVFNAFIKLITIIYQSIIKALTFLVKQLYMALVVPFLPSYKVIFSLYQVIPGLPINKNDSIHSFDKGTGKKAVRFYNDVVKSTAANGIVPAEVKLIKRKKTVAIKSFGPVAEIKKFSYSKAS